MGLRNGKISLKPTVISMDKKISPNLLKSESNKLELAKLTSKICENNELSFNIKDKLMIMENLPDRCTEVPVEICSLRDIQMKMLNDHDPYYSTTLSKSIIAKFDQNFDNQEIDELGIYLCSSYNERQYFHGVIYLPECHTTMVHYLTLYRLKMDNLTESAFQNWCLSFGHANTSTKYCQLRDAYMNLKSDHFKESFIVNKIISKQNVHLEISDLFDYEHNSLRAVVLIGKRDIVKAVLDSYCYNIRAKVPFIIKSSKDYRKLNMLINKQRKVKQKLCTNKVNLGHIFKPSPTRISFNADHFKNFFNDSHFFEENPHSVNVLKSTNDDFFQFDISQSNLMYEPFSKYKIHRPMAKNKKFTFKIFFEGVNYHLVSLTDDKEYMYFLCENNVTNVGKNKEIDVKSILKKSSESKIDEHHKIDYFNTIEKIIQDEILNIFQQKSYGFSKNKIPCSQFFVVQCTIGCQSLLQNEGIVNEILNCHMINGEIVEVNDTGSETNFDDRKFIFHLQGNERHVRKCCSDLKLKRLANNFQLIHPQSGRMFQKKLKRIYLDVFDVNGNL